MDGIEEVSLLNTDYVNEFTMGESRGGENQSDNLLEPKSNEVFMEGVMKFNLHAYLRRYKGMAYVERLYYIVIHIPCLYDIALKELMHEIKENDCLTVYQRLVKEGVIDANTDSKWFQVKQQEQLGLIRGYEAKLEAYKSSLSKEKIRTCQIELGHIYYNSGDYYNALKHYIHTKDFYQVQEHLLESILYSSLTSFRLKKYSYIFSAITRIEQFTQNSPPLKALINGIFGILLINENKYYDATKKLLEVDFSALEDLSKIAGFERFGEILSTEDVATYIAVMGLAEFGREDIYRHLVDNPTLKSYLDISTDLYEFIRATYYSNYSSFLELHKAYKNDLKLDSFFCPHVDRIFGKLMDKVMIQYVTPYSLVDLRVMSEIFNRDLISLEGDLVALMAEGLIAGRMDTQNKLLYFSDADESETLERIIRNGDQFVKQALNTLLRINLLNKISP